ncbi:MAG: protein-glutamate O-methyltransferase CheR [Phycisphaeraceae bacterium]|nr:protein-glutamate O-methyltransferase CheR [Phycisphaeraceae bacterium]
MSTAALTLSDQQFERLRNLVYERSGIWFQDSKKYVLETRLSRRLEELEFEDFNQYLMFLSVGPYREDEFQEMFNRITINETSFFRNEPQLEVFEKQILPKLIESRRAAKKLRIWSAACSSGEEPYTLAIQLHRTLGVRLSDWTLEILGTDISEKVLLMAQAGKYASYSIRGMHPLTLQRYFKETDGYFQIDPTIQSMVHFELLNLKDSFAAKRFGIFDVIFCRNVLIYFDDKMKTHCAKMFHDQLAPDGTLFIGHSESLRYTAVPFDPLPVPQAFAYLKKTRGPGA